MENNADRIRRLILLIVSGLFVSFYASAQEDGITKNYAHVNVGLSANNSVIFTDSIKDLTYDFGVGFQIEYETFFSDHFSLFGGAGVTYIRSSSGSKSNSLSAANIDLRVAPKFTFNGRFSVLGGPTLLYAINSRVKTSYIDESWSDVNYLEETQFGAFGGFEFYLNGWSSLRTLAIYRTSSFSWELSWIITPKLLK